MYKVRGDGASIKGANTKSRTKARTSTARCRRSHYDQSQFPSTAELVSTGHLYMKYWRWTPISSPGTGNDRQGCP
jgi:hypothetical protein